MDFIKVAGFNGSALNDSNFAALTDWRMLYNSIFSMQINGTPFMQPLADINNTIAAASTNPIAFTSLYYTYQSYSPTAVSNNLVYVQNGQIYDVAGRSQSPYINNNVFAVAPTIQSLSTGNSSFIFPSNLWFSNTGKTISSLQIDPEATGNYQTISLDIPFSLTFNTTGFVNVNIKATFTDGTVKLAHTKFYVFAATRTTAARYGNNFPYTPIPITATKAYLGSVAQGDYMVDLSVKNHTGHIRKPLIIVNGLDPDARNANTGIRYLGDGGYLQKINFDMNFQDWLIHRTPLNGTSGLDDAAEYDLIYLHWWNGTDFIQRNAYLLERLIEIVNQQKIANGSTEQNVILGYSMGGLITRYALRDMENNSQPHNTRLFISHDAPHNGANIPVAMQLAVQQLAHFKNITAIGSFPYYWITYQDMFPDAVNAVNLLNSPAARQMIIQRYILSANSPNSWSMSADNTTYQNFMNELNTLGWPQNCKNIALSNGTCNGNIQFPENGTMMTTAGHSSYAMTYLGGLWRSWAITLGTGIGTAGTMSGGNPLIEIPLSLFTTNSSFNVDFDLNAVPPSNQSSLIYRGNIYIHKEILWGLANYDRDLTTCSINSTSDMLPLDNTQGSVVDLRRNDLITLPTSINGIPTMPDNYFRLTIVNSRFCFIPTVSALAFDNPWQYYRQNICSNIPCHLPNAVADWYVPPVNQLHVSYTVDNSNWLLQRQALTFNCNKFCAENVAVQGSEVFCSGTKTYTLNVSASTPIVWSTGGSSIVSLPTPLPTSNSITVTKVQNGEFTIAATVSNVCNSNDLYFSKTVVVGPPPTNITILGMQNPGTGITTPTTWSFSAPSFTGATYMWYLDGSKYLNTGNENFLNLLIPCKTKYNVQCKVMNACGMSNLSNAITTSIGYCKLRKNAGISTFPIDHPIEAPKKLNVSVATTSSELFGHLFYDKESLANEMIQGVNVYNKKGELVMQTGALDTKATQLDFTEQADGTYFIEVLGKDDFRELHTFYYSSINQEEYILDNIANGSIAINGDRATERLYVMQQKLFNDLQCNEEAMNASTTLQDFAKENATGSFGYIWLVQNALGIDDITKATALLDKWLTTNTIDNNFKNYYNYYIKTVSNISLNAVELDALHTIAQGCPLTDGEIVYAARDLYNYLQPNNTDDYSNACISIGLRMANPNKPEIVSTSKANIIYPNPSKGNITIDNLDYGTKNISITNIYGQSVLQQQTNNKALSLNLKLNAGVYFVNIANSKTGKTATQKLIIQ